MKLLVFSLSKIADYFNMIFLIQPELQIMRLVAPVYGQNKKQMFYFVWMINSFPSFN